MNDAQDPRLDVDRALLARLKSALPALRAARGGPRTADGVYRFYHQSFKVFGLQETTQGIVDALRAVDPDRPLNPWFLQIVAEGTGRQFKGRETNEDWLRQTRPIVEAYFHADHMLRMAIESAEQMDDATPVLPYYWATVLYLYQQR